LAIRLNGQKGKRLLAGKNAGIERDLTPRRQTERGSHAKTPRRKGLRGSGRKSRVMAVTQFWEIHRLSKVRALNQNEAQPTTRLDSSSNPKTFASLRLGVGPSFRLASWREIPLDAARSRPLATPSETTRRRRHPDYRGTGSLIVLRRTQVPLYFAVQRQRPPRFLPAQYCRCCKRGDRRA